MKPICLPALLAVLSMATLLPAQNPTEPAATDPAKAVKSDTSRIDLKIDGVPLPDLIDYLAETTGKNIVLLVPPRIDATQIKVPALKLKHVSLEQILELIMQMPGVALSYDVSGEADSQIFSIRVESVEQTNPPQPAPGGAAFPGAAMPAEPFGGPGGFAGYPSAPGEPFLSVVPLERVILGNSPAERVPDDAKRKEMLDERTKQALTLLDQAFAMTPGEAKPEIKLHPDTNTLLVRASPAQLQVINQVLSALEVPGPSDVKRDFERKAVEIERQMDMDRQRMSVDMERRSAQLEQALMRAQKEQEELQVRNRELIEQVEHLKAQLAQKLEKQSKTEALESQLAQLERQLGQNNPSVEKLRAELKQLQEQKPTQPQ